MNNQALIILPGWGLESNVWSFLQKDLSKQHELYFVDWHGIRTITEFKERVIDLIEKHRLKSYILLGCSLGSLVALEIASTYPSQVKGVIMLGGTSCFTAKPSDGYDSGWSTRIVERMKLNLGRAMRKTLLAFYTSMFSESELENRELECFLSSGTTEFWEKDIDSLLIGLDYLINMDLRNELKNILSPILLIHGEEDKICPRTAAQFNALQLKEKAALKTLPKTGHLPLFTQPEECLGYIQKFIREC